MQTRKIGQDCATGHASNSARIFSIHNYLPDVAEAPPLAASVVTKLMNMKIIMCDLYHTCDRKPNILRPPVNSSQCN
jgi:hypothetical protein